MRRKYPTIIAVLGLFAGPGTVAHADDLISDDQIVQGSLCVGADCDAAENFEFDTIRLKSPLPMIEFIDTSTSSSFPSNDWALGATDGGTSEPPHFFIRDLSSDVDVARFAPSVGGGVVLGAGSVLEKGAISIGAPGNERRIAHVAPAVTDTDAVNLAQFNQFKTDINDSLSSEKAQMDAELTALRDRLSELANDLDYLADRVNAKTP